MKLLKLLLLCAVPSLAAAQQWSGIIDPARAVDWGNAGVFGDIPSGSWANCTTAACNTLFGGSVTTSTINAALSSAGAIATLGAPLVVRIPAGNFSSIGCLQVTFSNVVLRGTGADSTKLSFTGNCSGGGLGGSRSVNLMSGAAGVGCGASCGGTPPSNTATWSAGYTQGATSITLSNVSGLTAGAAGVGSVIFLDQLDDATGTGYPTVNDVIQCSVQDAWCSNKGDGNHWGRAGRSMIQAVTVTAIAGVGPFTVTISPGVAFPTVRAGQSPGAWWNNTQIHNSGIENMTLDFTSAGDTYGIFIKDTSNTWVSGVRHVNTASDTGAFYGNWVMNSAHVTLRSNYFYGKNTTCSPFPLENYAITTKEVSDSLFENNIFQHTNNAYVPNDPGDRNVFSYNWIVGSIIGAAGGQPHSGLIGMDLYEGNDWQSYYGDVTHGSHMFMTLYRNLFDGTANNTSCTVGQALTMMTNNRFGNAVANVFGSTSYSQYEDNVNNTGGAPNAVYELGWIGNNSGTTVSADSNVKRTLLRWGNWDLFTSTNRTAANDQTGVRWCGNSSDTGWVARCASTTEVPSAIANFPNPIPTKGDTGIGQPALPASFYLSSAPSWFGSIPFPPIGPDVSSGNAPNTASVPTGGHANKIPSRACYESLSNDAAYGALNIKSFNASTCYVAPPAAPAVGLTPSSLSFGNIVVSVTTSAQTVTLTNTGSATLTITSITLTGANAADFAISSNACGGTLGVGLNCAVGMTFTPSASGARTASLTFTTNASTSPNNAPLSGTGVPAFTVSLSPTSLVFPSTGLGVTSSAKTVTLTNTGPSAVTITSITLTGANAGDYAISNNPCGASLAAGSNCIVSVTFTPTALGARTASLTFLTNASTSPDSATLSGTGVTPPVPAVTLNPGSLSFGNIVVGATTSAQTVTLTNSGTATLTIASIALTGANAADFNISANGCGASLGAGLNCAVSVTFSPSATGVRSASLTFTTNAAGSPNSASLSGTGVNPFVVSLSPASEAFGSIVVAGTSASQTATLTNTGPATVTITSVSLSGANAGDFAIPVNTCGASLAAGLNCTVSVTFTPSALGGRSASLTFLTNASSSPDSASLSGTGVASPTPSVTLNPISLSFGNVTVASTSTGQTVTLTNSGTATLSITSISLTGVNATDFAISANTCGSSLAVAQNCAVSVTFKPLATGVRSASLTFLTNSASSPNNITLSGTGVSVPPGHAKKHGKNALLIP